MRRIDEALAFYASHYDEVARWSLRRGERKVVLGEALGRRCRFCGERPPRALFKQEAHAVPEATGNGTLFTNYECDACNSAFGAGIENDFGNWSKPMRTIARTKGKSGVPTIKGPQGKWRLQNGRDGLDLSHDRIDQVFDVDEGAKTMTFRLPRDVYTPIAVYKAFTKMGLSLVPDHDLPSFARAFSWISNPDHTIPIVPDHSIMAQMIPGPAQAGGIVLAILRRQNDYLRLPFAFLLVAYSNQIFQISLPSPEKNWSLSGREISIPWYPGHSAEFAERFGPPQRYRLDLNGTDIVRGEIVTMVMHYETRIER